MRAINRAKWILTINAELLINEGVPVDRVLHLLLLQPRVFMQSREGIANAVKTVREFGIEPDEGQFIYGLRIVSGFSETNLRKKLQVFKSFGCSDEQVSNVFKTFPACLGLYEENRSKMGLFLDTLKLEPETVTANPVLLGYSTERIRARYEVLNILKSENLVKSTMKIITVTTMTEDNFLETYVIKHEESVPGLLDTYYGIAYERKNRQRKKN